MIFHVSDEVITVYIYMSQVPTSFLQTVGTTPPAISGDPAQIGLSGAKPCGCSTFKRLGKQ